MIKNSITILFIVASVLLFVFYVSPTYGSIQVLLESRGEYEIALQNARKLQSIRESLISKRNSFSQLDINRLEKLLPDNVDNVKLILELQTIAQEHNLRLQTASAQEEEEEQNGNKGIDVETKDYGIITLAFELTGLYPDFVDFLEEVSSSLRIIDISAMNFTRSTVSGNSNYQFSMELKTYWLKDNI